MFFSHAQLHALIHAPRCPSHTSPFFMPFPTHHPFPPTPVTSLDGTLDKAKLQASRHFAPLPEDTYNLLAQYYGNIQVGRIALYWDLLL